MAMGSNGMVNITQQMMNDILSAVSDYRGKATALAQRLDDTVNGMIPANFDGNAATEFKGFYTKNIVENLIEEGLKKLLEAIEAMASGILEAIPGEGGLDDQLADGNRQ